MNWGRRMVAFSIWMLLFSFIIISSGAYPRRRSAFRALVPGAISVAPVVEEVCQVMRALSLTHTCSSIADGWGTFRALWIISWTPCHAQRCVTYVDSLGRHHSCKEKEGVGERVQPRTSVTSGICDVKSGAHGATSNQGAMRRSHNFAEIVPLLLC